MAYQTMLPMLKSAQGKDYAVPAFNILNHLTAASIVDAGEKTRSPLILQTSVVTVKQIGVKRLAEFLIPMAQNAAVPVAVHLDHCKDADIARACIDAGWSSVMIDYSDLPLEDNIQKTREIVEYARGRDVSVEGELGAVVGVEDDIVVGTFGAILANEADSLRFVSESGVHVFAPAIGTAHGHYKNNPSIDFDLFARLAKALTQPLVIHGGTGLSEDVFKRLIELGAAKINISTAVKAAYIDGVSSYLDANPEGRNPLKMDLSAYESVQKTAMAHIRIFNSEGRA